MTTTHQVVPIVIGIGSNAPDRHLKMEQALADMRAMFSDVKASEVYETLAYNQTDASPYLNAVVSCMSALSETEINDRLKQLEEAAGRHDSGPGIIALDLDLVIYNGKIVRPVDFERPYFNIGYRQLLADGAFQYSPS